MAEDAVTVYTCEDGSDFPVHWERPEDHLAPWVRNADHWPAAAPPLEVALGAAGLPGRLRAFDEVDIPCLYTFRRSYAPHGFVYLNQTQYSPAEAEQWLRGAEALIARYGGVLEVWTGYCLPKIKEICRRLQMDEPSPLADLADAWAYSQNLTMVAAAVLRSRMQPLGSFLMQELGAEGERLQNDLMQGQANATIDADQALWRLAQLAASSPRLKERLLDSAGMLDPAELYKLDSGGEFRRAFEAFLDEYGWRSEVWQLIAFTWRERPQIALSLIRSVIASQAPSPLATQQQSLTRGQELADSVRDRLPSDKRGAFDALLAPLSGYTTVREGRAQWQLIGIGSMRHAVLRRGDRLAEAGLIESRDDVWFLLPDEVEAAPPRSDLRGLIEDRRKDHEYWASKIPPPIIGGPPPPEARGLAPGVRDGSSIRGIGASRGTATARARVILDLADAQRLQRGDVLVTVMTAPPWTPLFGIASAIVTDTGGLLSHPSIAAREYGIPCVVGARTATRDIRDGAVITVDGEAGTVSW